METSFDAQAQATPLDALLPAVEKRRPGRAKGAPRVPGSGRKPGTPNGTTRDARLLIETKGKPIEFLCAIIRGQRVRVGPQAGPGQATFAYPTLGQRIDVALALTGKIVPDLRSHEHTGPDGAALGPTTQIVDNRVQISAAFHGMLAVCAQANPKLAAAIAEAKPETTTEATP